MMSLQNTIVSLACTLAIVAALPVTSFAQTRAQEGAVLGGVAGAILGGIAGHQNDETPEGIAIGGVAGAIAGGLLGKAQDNQMIRDYQHQQVVRQQRAERLGRAVSMQDVISLSNSGVSPTLIMNQIQDNGVTHRLTVNDIIQLHQAGVPEVVINSMQQARLAANAPAPVTVERVVEVPAAPSTIVVESYHQGPVIRHHHYGPGPRYGYSTHRYYRW